MGDRQVEPLHGEVADLLGDRWSVHMGHRGVVWRQEALSSDAHVEVLLGDRQGTCMGAECC